MASVGVGFHVASNAVLQAKTAPGSLVGWWLDNVQNSAVSYYQFFDALAVNVTLGVTVPKFVVVLPAGQAGAPPCPGALFATAISFAVTTTYNGSTAPASPVDCTLFVA